MDSAKKLQEALWPYILRRLTAEIKAGVTQTALADRVGVKQPTINRWLNGERVGVSLDDALKACRALGVSVSDVCKEIGEDDLGVILEQFINDRDQLIKLAKILKAGGSAKRKIQAEIDFIYDQVEQR